MRQALRIGGGLVAIGLVVYAVIAVSSGGSEPTTKSKRARVTEARDTESDGEVDRGKAAPKKKAPVVRRDAKGVAVERNSVPIAGAKLAPIDPVPERYEEAHDELVGLVEKVEAMAARGEHFTQKEFVEIYRRGDMLSVALMKTPEVSQSTDVRSQLSKLNQRFRMKMTEVGPVPADQ
ncbi:MAG TPA: hypothetical protein VG755_07345 [Nannocystaceae bacterium]|nr:hypothetical protein [Nannocystaceae bacterium]